MSEQKESLPQTRRVSWFIPTELHDRLTLHSHKTGIGVQQIVADMIAENIPTYKLEAVEPPNAAS